MVKQTVISRQLERAVFNMTTSEWHLFSLAVAKIDSMKEVPTLEPIKVTQEDFGGEQPWRDLKYAADKLFTRFWKLSESGRHGKYRFITAREIVENDRSVLLHFSDHLAPHIMMIRGNVTPFLKYCPGELQNLRGKYAPRIYLALRMGHAFNQGNHQFTPEQLRKMFDLGDSYKKTARLRLSVLEGPLKEINDKTEFTIRTEKIKTLWHRGKITAWLVPFTHPDQKEQHSKALARKTRENQEIIESEIHLPGLSDV